MMRRLRSGCAVLILAATTALTSVAVAEPSAADKETARALVLDGRVKLEAKDYQGALKAFQAAHAIMGVPTTGLDLARAQAALRMLVEARATALDVTRIPAAPREPEAFTNARAAAEKLAEEVAVRIPSLEVRTKGPPAGTHLLVKVDGLTIPPEALGLPRKVNPGEHTVEASAPRYAMSRRTVTLKEGEVLPLEIPLAPEGARTTDNGQPAGATAAETPAAAATADNGAKTKIPVWAWVSGAGGIVAAGVGVAFAIDHASVRSTVSEDCPNDECAPGLYDAAGVEDLKSRWNRDIGLAVGLGAAGLIGIGAAVYGIMTAPPANASDAPGRAATGVAMTPWLSPSAAGGAMMGSF